MSGSFNLSRTQLRVLGSVVIASALAVILFLGFSSDKFNLEDLKAPEHITESITDSITSWIKPAKYDPKRLHLLVPATSTNYHFCQLMMSTAVMGYPAPVLVNWGAAEAADAYEQHIIKVQGILNYTQNLPPESSEDDLVFMLDGFDAWFQLPADMLIQRYYDTVEQAADSHEAMFGADTVKQHDIRNTVLWGPDKVCWPGPDERGACWAVPESYLPQYAFGPDTDRGIPEHNRARWLNSGTAMGTAREMEQVFSATMDKLNDHFVTNSDQFYFAEVFADQSYKRRLAKLEYDRSRGVDVAADEEYLLPGENNPKDIPSNPKEYYMGLDSDSVLWQTIAFYEDYITWIRHNESNAYTRQESISINPYHYFPLPDYLKEGSPLASAGLSIKDKNDKELPEELESWTTVPLATNTISKTTPPVLHFTGKKQYRDIWWLRNWFYPHQGKILEARRAKGLSDTGRYRDALAGAWTFADGKMGWMAWDDLCGEYEEDLQR